MATEIMVADPDARILLLTTFELGDHGRDAVAVGARGILLKDVPPARLLDAVRRVAGGRTVLPPTARASPAARDQRPGAAASAVAHQRSSAW